MLFVFNVNFLVAQTEKGNLLGGGNASVNYNFFKFKLGGNNHYIKSYSIGLNPSVGYFVADRFTIGGVFGLSVSKYDDNPAALDERYGVFSRYYLKNNFFTQAAVATRVLSDPFADQRLDTELNLAIGYAYFVNKSIAFEPNASVVFKNGYNFRFALGFQMYFAREDFKRNKRLQF